jgi:hypothetical protein
MTAAHTQMRRWTLALVVAGALCATTSSSRAQETSYVYAVTVHDNGTVWLRQAQTFSPDLIPQFRCPQTGIRQQPNAPAEWHLNQLGGWSDGACQMVGPAEFASMDAFRTYLKMFGVGTINDAACGPTLHLTLPVQPPNPTTRITVALKLPGAEPITPGSRRSGTDEDTLTWTLYQGTTAVFER